MLRPKLYRCIITIHRGSYVASVPEVVGFAHGTCVGSFLPKRYQTSETGGTETYHDSIQPRLRTVLRELIKHELPKARPRKKFSSQFVSLVLSGRMRRESAGRCTEARLTSWCTNPGTKWKLTNCTQVARVISCAPNLEVRIQGVAL